MHLIYLVFGANIRNHFQANFSILSFLRQPATLDGITVATDTPEFYQHLAGHVTVMPVDEDTLREWKGEFNFFWRVKIQVLSEVAQQRPGTALLYLDSDTFLHGSLTSLQNRLVDGQAFMHEREGALSELTSKTERLMWEQIKQKTFGGVRLHECHGMWNAGVVGIPAERTLQAIELALNLCDDFSRQSVTPRLIEQFALSVALEETYPLHTAQPYIGHYWSTKEEWNEHIAAFLLESHLKKRTVSEELTALEKFNFQSIPVKKRVKNIRWRLVNLVERIFPPREIVYAKPE